MPAADLLAALERYQFTDALGHPLAGCAEYIEIVRRLQSCIDVAAPLEADRAAA